MREGGGTVSGGGAPATVAIIGLGLIGGSLARDLVARGWRVLAMDSSREVIDAAVLEGVVIEALDDEFAGVSSAELVILATPVDSAEAVLRRIAPRLSPHTSVTDVGSTKASICAYAEAVGIADRFVGSHPLAGDHRAGWGASRPDLFRDARVYLCPTRLTTNSHLDRIRALWSDLGARTEILNPEAHDRRMAWVSHLPQAVSSALARVLLEEGIGWSELGPGGRDMLRLAASDPRIWTAITLDNADFLEESVSGLVDQIGRFRAALRDRDREAIASFFGAASRWQSSKNDLS